MRESDSLLPVMFAVAMGFALIAAIFLSADLAIAQDNSAHDSELICLTTPDTAAQCETAIKATIKLRKERATARASFNESDQLAALRAVQFALSNLGDGAKYVWQRGNGRLKGIVQPTESFKDGNGKICRHVVVQYTAGDYSRSIETLACRRDSSVWVLSG